MSERNKKYIMTRKNNLQLFVILIGISSTPLYGIEALYIYIISCIIPYSISFNNEGEIKYEKIKDKKDIILY